jgi:hypothetical protein
MSKKEFKEDFLEELAALEHKQWVAWSLSIANDKTVVLSDERLARWATLWIPYEDLSEEMKEHDRKWARKVLDVLSEIVDIFSKVAKINNRETALELIKKLEEMELQNKKQHAE